MKGPNKSRVAAANIALTILVTAAVALGASLALSAHAQQQQSTWVVEPQVAAPDDEITGVYMTGINTAWLAINENGTGFVYYIQWQGTHWARTYTSPAFRCPLRSVVAVSYTDVLSVGDC